MVCYALCKQFRYWVIIPLAPTQITQKYFPEIISRKKIFILRLSTNSGFTVGRQLSSAAGAQTVPCIPYRLPYNVVVACYACTAEGASGVNLCHSLIIIYIVCLIDVTMYGVSYFMKMDRIHVLIVR